MEWLKRHNKREIPSYNEIFTQSNRETEESEAFLSLGLDSEEKIQEDIAYLKSNLDELYERNPELTALTEVIDEPVNVVKSMEDQSITHLVTQGPDGNNFDVMDFVPPGWKIYELSEVPYPEHYDASLIEKYRKEDILKGSYANKHDHIIGWNRKPTRESYIILLHEIGHAISIQDLRKEIGDSADERWWNSVWNERSAWANALSIIRTAKRRGIDLTSGLDVNTLREMYLSALNFYNGTDENLPFTRGRLEGNENYSQRRILEGYILNDELYLDKLQSPEPSVEHKKQPWWKFWDKRTG